MNAVARVDRRRRPASVWALIVFCAIQAVSGLAGGLGLVLSPDGSFMQFPADGLEGTPFSDFLIPGLILLIVLGVYPLIVVYGLWRRQSWGWWGAGVLGVGLVIWLVVEVILLGSSLLESGAGFAIGFWVGYGVVAVIILLLAVLPATRRWYLAEVPR